MPVNDPAQTLIAAFDVTFNSVGLGYTDNVRFRIQQQTKEIKVAQAFDQVLGERLMGVVCDFEVDLREIIVANFKLAFPWWSGSGAIPACPPTLGGDLYAYAQSLRLHPRHKGDTTEDIVAAKAVWRGGYEIAGDGKSDTIIRGTFRAYPNRASFPNIEIVSIG